MASYRALALPDKNGDYSRLSIGIALIARFSSFN